MSFKPESTIPVGSFAKTDTGMIKLSIVEYSKGKHSLDLRRWYKKKAETEFNPGKGITVPVEDLSKLKRAIEAAEKKAKKAGLIK